MAIAPSDAALELLARAAACEHLLGFTRYTFPTFQYNWHHGILFDTLDAFVSRDIRRLMVFAPPRSTKSESVSRRLPAYILGKNPDAGVIACSHTATLAESMNRDVQRIIDERGYANIFPDTKLFGANVRTTAHGNWLRNSDEFEIVERRGRYLGKGVGGGIAGRGFDYGIIDDPIKNRKEADSKVFRQMVWNWYTNDFLTRQDGADSCILLTVTRWHDDDLAGRLLKLEKTDPWADKWHVLRFPAIADGDQMDVDPRQYGEALWPDKFPAEFYLKQKAADPRGYEALYQQRPRAPDGTMFKRHWFEPDNIVGAVPVEARRVRYWDAASTQDGGDFTSGVLIAEVNGVYFVEDVVRGQWRGDERNKVIKQVAHQDAERYQNSVKVWREEEPGSSGKDVSDAFIKMLAGHPVKVERVTGDKAVRAQPFADQCEPGNVKLLRASWNSVYLEELASFPTGANDDMVDASSGAFGKLARNNEGLVLAFM